MSSTWKIVISLFILGSFSVQASWQQSIHKEKVRDHMKSILLGEQSMKDVSSYGAEDVIDAAFDLDETALQQRPVQQNISKALSHFNLGVLERFQWDVLKDSYGELRERDHAVVAEVRKTIESGQADKKLHYWVFNHGSETLVEAARKKSPEIWNDWKKPTEFRPKTREELRDLFYNNPDLTTFQNGAYDEGIQLFLFCRHDRNFPCRFVMKDKNRLPVFRDDTAEIWTHPALAASSRGLPSHIVNGQTPMGVHLLDGVMPEANRQLSFGAFRRVILNWVPANKSDALTKSLLPSSALENTWWQQASVSRDVGRKDLRIHGTGRRGGDPSDSFYPFRKTAGCISQREGLYDGTEFIDQRLILDDLMKARDLEPVFENESAIKGILYVIEIDDEKRPVSHEDLVSILQDGAQG